MGKAFVPGLSGRKEGGWTVKVCAQETRTWVATSSDRGSVVCPAGSLRLPEKVSMILLRADHEQVAGDASKLSGLPVEPINPLGFGSVGFLLAPLNGYWYTLAGNGDKYLTSTGRDFSAIVPATMAGGSIRISLLDGVFSWERIGYAFTGGWYQNVTNTERNCAVVQYI